MPVDDSANLEGSGETVNLGLGYSVSAPGFVGKANLREHQPAGARRTGAAKLPQETQFDGVLQDSDVREQKVIELEGKLELPDQATTEIRAPRRKAVTLQVRAPGADFQQVLLVLDDSGVATWHFPAERAGSAGATRGIGATNTFVIPYSSLPGERVKRSDGTRGGMAVVGRKIVKVLVYPVTDRVLGPLTEHFAQSWEGKHRPHRLRTFTAENYQDPNISGLTNPDWERLRDGKALLFIHGTFSSAQAFRDLPFNVIATLNQHYGDRVFAFNHPSVGTDPLTNARWFIEQIPNDIRLDLDIVCHSRGGLVARSIARELAPGSKGKVGRIVFVGAPNAGTILADADHMTNMIDRFTTVLSLLPTGNPAEILEGIVCAVKVLGHSMLNGLPGLLSMKPGGSFLSNLGSASGPDNPLPEYFGITSDYTPNNPALLAFLRESIKNKLVDRIFGETANDMVVPTRGVFEVDKATNFPIASERVLSFGAADAVTHTTYFKEQRTGDALVRWLI
jgi:pimeloyl-ACP methyl ester carboxylesterase